MGADDGNQYQQGGNNKNRNSNAKSTDIDGFAGYVETSVDPGKWMLLGTVSFCVLVMLVVMPLIVLLWKRRRKIQQTSDAMMQEALNQTTVTGAVSVTNITRCDKETGKILGLAGPFTISAAASSVCSNVCLIIVSRFIGTTAVTAYAIVQLLVGLSDGVLYGPISACTTLCSQAVGAGNSNLAGEYIQLALSTYLCLGVPVAGFWCFYMYEVVLYLEWGDEEAAQLAQDFVRPYMLSGILSAVSYSIWQLLEVTEHAVIGTVCSVIWGVSDVVIMSILATMKPLGTLSLSDVAWVYNGTSLFFVVFTYILADCRGWLEPFKSGLFRSCSMNNITAIKAMSTQALPLSIGYLMSNAEWAVLTFMASALGPAEVAAWAILGSIWDVFLTTTAGIGDAAEIRVAYHLGENSPVMAELSAYKSLFWGMVTATITSIIYLCLQDQIPIWFTTDETLQSMLRELVPFVGVANLAMTFGMQCWSIIGSQGKYSLATSISCVSSWGICMPLAAVSTYIYRFDLQGLAASVTIGYVTTGTVLSCILLCTDWRAVANAIQGQNAVETVDEDTVVSDSHFGALSPHRNGGKAAARRNIHLVTVPAGKRAGISVGPRQGKPGYYIVAMDFWSPLRGVVHVGNVVLAVNGREATKMSPNALAEIVQNNDIDRYLAVVAPQIDDNDDFGLNAETTSGLFC